MFQFLPYGGGQDHPLKQRRQDLHMPDEHEIVDRACISNDEAGHPSKSQTLKRGNIPAQVVDRVLHPHAMSLQKSIEFITGIDTEQATKLRLADSPCFVFLQGERLKDPAR